MLRLPAKAADASLAAADVNDDGGASLTPSRLRSPGSSRASSVSSGIASTRPAPKSGIGARLAITSTSSGIVGWQPCDGVDSM
jgi:hypothetical protein